MLHCSGFKFIAIASLFMGVVGRDSLVLGQETDEAAAPRDSVANQMMDVLSDTAQRALQRGAFDDAETLFRRLLEKDPNRPNDIASLATALARQQKLVEAIEVLRDGAERFPNNAKIAAGLGQAHLAQQEDCEALYWLQQAEWLDPSMPDLGYYLGSAYLRIRLPMTALWQFYNGQTSSRRMAWQQDLGIGAAHAQLGLQMQASSYFNSVLNEADDPAVTSQAVQLQQQMDDSFFGACRLRGSVKTTVRHDDNPGIVPTANTLGAPLNREPSAGNLLYGQFDYDLIRKYNFGVTAGYTFLHTTNYEAHRFDLLDNAVYVSAVRRGLCLGRPDEKAIRLEYDNLLVGGNNFLSRTRLTPAWTVRDSDHSNWVGLVRYTSLDFLGQGILDPGPFDQDSTNYAIGLYRRKEMCGREITWTLGYELDRNESDGSNFDYVGNRFLVGTEWDLPWHRLELDVLNYFYLRGYDNPNSVFGVPRDDKQYTVQVTLRAPLCEQWYLSFEWLYDRNDSNLIINDFNRQLFEVALEYRFPYSNRRRRY